MELRHLRYFLAVAEHLSFSRAAEALHMAQPPLSRQVQTLERELDVHLLDRSRRQIALTDAGKVLATEARRILDDAASTAELVHRVGARDRYRVVVDFVPSAIVATLPEIMHEFRSVAPDVELVLREGVPDQIIESLHSGTTDVGFIHLPKVVDQVIAHELLLTEPFVAALSAGHRLAGADEVGLTDLAAEDFILNTKFPGGGMRGAIVRLCAEAGFTPRVRQEAWLLQTTLSLVSAGAGVSIVPASMAEAGRAGVVFKTIRDCTQVVGLWMLWRRDYASPAAFSFVDVARGWAQHADAVAAVDGPPPMGVSYP